MFRFIKVKSKVPSSPVSVGADQILSTLVVHYEKWIQLQTILTTIKFSPQKDAESLNSGIKLHFNLFQVRKNKIG